MALSLGGRAPVEIKEPLELRSDVRVEGLYHSRSGVRTAGVVTMILGGVAGLLMTTGSLFSTSNEYESNYGLIAGGSVVLCVSLVVGMILIFQRDKAEARVTAY